MTSNNDDGRDNRNKTNPDDFLNDDSAANTNTGTSSSATAASAIVIDNAAPDVMPSVAAMSPPVPDAQRIIAYEEKMDKDDNDDAIKAAIKVKGGMNVMEREKSSDELNTIIRQFQHQPLQPNSESISSPTQQLEITIPTDDEDNEQRLTRISALSNASTKTDDNEEELSSHHHQEGNNNIAMRRMTSGTRGSDCTPIIPEAFLVEEDNNIMSRTPAVGSIIDAEIIVPPPWYKQNRFILAACSILIVVVVGIALGLVKGSAADDINGNNVAADACKVEENECGVGYACPAGTCCSQFGYCGITEDFCGDCCQGGDCWDDFTLPTTLSNYSYTTAKEDSRLIAYLGNWDDCPTPAQIRGYSHIIISSVVTYSWSPSKSICNKDCDINAILEPWGGVNICGNEVRQDLVDAWRKQGKKVILGFGGSGMGTSWIRDQNNCWDYCFGKEEQLVTNLTNIVKNQNFDGINIDYPYCYDVNKTQYGRCLRRTDLYSDEKAQIFLSSLTSMLRSKLDALPKSPARQKYELSHTAFDVDLIGEESAFYKILQKQSADINYLLGRFYNAMSQPAIDGLFFREPPAAHLVSAGDIYTSIVNGIFDGDATRAVFGFCISGCSSTLTNVNSTEAVKILQDLKSYNDGDFKCFGGVYIWRVLNDYESVWSSSVLDEIMLSAGCSDD